MSLRLLFPLLLNYQRTEIPGQEAYLTTRWHIYHVMRFLVLWAAMLTLLLVGGMKLMLVSAMLFGLTLRFDYWSNCVELLGAAIVFAGGGNDWSLGYALVAGLVLGSGRETLPLLALTFSPFGCAFGLGAGVSQAVVRRLHRPDRGQEHRAAEAQYGESQVAYNISVIFSGKPYLLWYAAIYLFLGVLAAFSQPVLAVALVAVTFIYSKIDEPRTLVMLVPFAAETLCKLM